MAENEAHDGGGTIRKAMLADVPGAQATFQWFAQCAETLARHRSTSRARPSRRRRTTCGYEPYGVTTGIIPWNFPLLMAAWKIAPSIAAGNCCVIKPASFTSVTALTLAQLIDEVDLPPGVVNVVAGPGGSVGEELASNPHGRQDRVHRLHRGRPAHHAAGVGHREGGHARAGRQVGQHRPRRRRPRHAAAGVLWGTFLHNGQVCESGTRALVHRGIYDEFLSLLADRAGKIVDRRPARLRHRPRPARLAPARSRRSSATWRSARTRSATLVIGGSKPETLADGLDRDAFFNPTIFADVDNTSKSPRRRSSARSCRVIPFDNDDQAVALANDSIYGLGGGVWSDNVDRAKTVAHGMRTGTVWINDYHLIDAKRPFGGYKQSGIGRELGTFGYDAYRQVKHVHVNPQAGRDGHVHYQMLSANI